MFRKNPPSTPPTIAPAERVTSVLGPGINWQGNLRGSGGAPVRVGYRINPARLSLYTHLVSYDVDGAREVVLPGETGFLVPPQRTDLLADALIQLAEDEPLRERLGRRACGRCRGRQSWTAGSWCRPVE